jgi:hypothetical protein
VIDAMEEYQNIQQPSDQVFEQSRKTSMPAGVRGIGCKISKGRGTAAWWTQAYAVIRPETQEA